MEIEVKYGIKDKETADIILEDKFLRSIEEEGSREAVYMKSVYFDTDDGILSENNIALRVRTEGEYTFATLKWAGKTEGATHLREEINVPINGEECIAGPDLGIFSESQTGRDLIKLVDGKKLHSHIEVNMLRRRFRIDTGQSIIEVSVDNGEIITEKGNAPVCEVELELFSGSREELEEISEGVRERYDLKNEEKSKYARGLELLNGEKAC